MFLLINSQNAARKLYNKPQRQLNRSRLDGSSLFTTTVGDAYDRAVAGGVAFPYFGADGRPDRNHTLGQPLPPDSGFLS